MIRVALYVRNRVEGVAQLVLTNLVHRPDDSMLPLGDVTSEAWGHETATGENRRALAQAGRSATCRVRTSSHPPRHERRRSAGDPPGLGRGEVLNKARPA